MLTNPEKRKMFDQGIDPLDPQSAHENWHPEGFDFSDFGHSFPFGSGGGGGSGYTFKFHFG